MRIISTFPYDQYKQPLNGKGGAGQNRCVLVAGSHEDATTKPPCGAHIQ